MPTQILVKKKKIYANVLFNTANFSEVIACFKAFKLKYLPDEKYWELPVAMVDNILEALEDIDRVMMTEEVEEDIEHLKKPPIMVESTGITFDESELKGTFKLGKAPFEHYQEEDIRKALSYTSYGLFWDMGCVAEGTVIPVEYKGRQWGIPIEKLLEFSLDSFKVKYLAGTNFRYDTCDGVVFSGEKPCLRLHLQDDILIDLTEDHEVLTIHDILTLSDFKEAQNLVIGEFIVTVSGPKKVVSIENVGVKKTYDIKMKAPYHNFIANGIVVHNCGKSFASSSIFHILKKRRHASKAIILTSASGVLNIAKELVKFSSVREDEIVIGNKFNRRPFDDLTKNIVICNYRSFLLISDEYQKDKDPSVKGYRKTPIPIEKWLDGEDGYFLLDESHHIADPGSRTSKVVYLVAPFMRFRNIMTGTPADKEEKYYSQLKFLDPSLVHNMSYSDWTKNYFNIGTPWSEYEVTTPKPEKIRDLVYIIRKFTVKRDSLEVLDLPENVFHKVYVQMTPKLQTIYTGFIEEKLKAIQAKKNGTLPVHAVGNFFQKMILSIDNPEMLIGDDFLPPPITKAIKSFNFLKDHPKIEILDEIIERHKYEKIIVWSSHPSVSQILHTHYKDSFIINGETEVPKGMTRDELKTKVVDEFKASKSKNILFAGIQVLNTAITIIEATVNVYFDTSFDYTQFSQSIKRIHRIGQGKVCNTYILIVDESLDVVRREMMEDKDFITKNFGNEEYLSLHSATDLFNRKGS